jgi:hypothetical protein
MSGASHHRREGCKVFMYEQLAGIGRPEKPIFRRDGIQG